MAAIDENCEYLGIKRLQLMENAGTAIANGITVLLKGVIDIISDGAEVRANRTGNAGMTVGGTGDVLAGLTGALFAKHNAFEAMCAALSSMGPPAI